MFTDQKNQTKLLTNYSLCMKRKENKKYLEMQRMISQIIQIILRSCCSLENNNKLKNRFSCQALNENIYKVQVVLMKCHVTAL